MFLKSFGGVVAAFTFSFSGTAIAQITNNNLYIQVGSDRNGDPITLDLASVKGSEYILLQQHGGGTTQTTLRASCSQGRLFSKKFSLYTSTGELISNEKTEREIFPKPGTPDAVSMEIVCRGVNTRSSQ
jgi:hypothetical protein